MKKAKLIFAIGMAYDLEDPNKFIGDIQKALHPQGVMIMQLMTLAPMLRQNDLGNVCHEHIEYYTYKSLVELYERNGLEIFRVEENEINGGSYKLYARLYKTGSIKYDELDLDVEAWIKRLEENRAKTRKYLAEAKKDGKQIYCYGASTKGNTILQWYDVAEYITAVADKNTEKHGLFTVGTNLPIVAESEARANADIFFVLPYAFIDTFVEREEAFLSRGGKMIVCTPEFKVYAN